jgi:hypothetical protein
VMRMRGFYRVSHGLHGFARILNQERIHPRQSALIRGQTKRHGFRRAA